MLFATVAFFIGTFCTTYMSPSLNRQTDEQNFLFLTRLLLWKGASKKTLSNRIVCIPHPLSRLKGNRPQTSNIVYTDTYSAYQLYLA